MSGTKRLETLSHTRIVAESLALQLRCGDVVTVAGDLGAGKTTFAQFLIQKLCGAAVEVTSPTFTILCTYPAILANGAAAEIHHYDLYRIAHPSALAELGLEEALQGVTIMEWPERLAGYDFPVTLALQLSLSEDGTRSLRAASNDPRFKDILA